MRKNYVYISLDMNCNPDSRDARKVLDLFENSFRKKKY